MENLRLLAPEMWLSGLALGLLLVDMLLPAKKSRWLYHLAWLIAAGVLVMTALTLAGATGAHGVGTLWSVDPFSQFLKMCVLLTTALCLLLGLDYAALPERHAGMFSALVLFSAAGLMFLLSATDLLLVFVALELVSLSSFILTGFERTNAKSNEGAMKYFLFGAFSSALMVYGISLYFGATGGTKLLATGAAPTPMLLLGLVLILLGFAFKASLAPMHFWVPDAYEGAPTPVTTFLSIAPKIATLGVLVRVFGVIFPAPAWELSSLLALMAVLTMTIGNFTAIFQDDVKRLLAYSSVAQAGYLLIGLASGDPLGQQGVLLYSFTYVAMNLGCFAVAQAVGQNAGHYGLSAFDGLYKRSFGLALAMSFCLLSLAGIPPFAGFMGKLYIFASAVKADMMWLAVVGVLNSVVSVYYYFRIAQRMFLRDAAGESEPLPVGAFVAGGVAVAVVGVLLFGVYPEPLIAGVKASTRFLP
jgi:NADH-quinone oxidoreductase subunit N